MKIKSISLHIIKMPLRDPFTTHLGTVTEREAIIVNIKDYDGTIGYGEAVPFSSPWYTEETIKTSFHMLVDFFIPLLKKVSISHPQELSPYLEYYKRNNMAKSGIETALWDLYAKQQGISLSKLLGGTRSKIASGVVVGAKSIQDALTETERYIKEGYKRIKVKISPEMDISLLKVLRRHYPNVAIMADANSAYSLQDLEKLKELDQFHLLMIEQPLRYDDIIDHAQLQKQINTPICLDESIVTLDTVRQAVNLGSCKIINIKISRVGGLYVAKNIHDYCLLHNIEVWCGGMLEFGISRAHNIALASLPGFSIPGDISASSRYWDEDIVEPSVSVQNGFIQVPEGPGIGFKINERRMKEVTIYKEEFLF